MRKLYLKRKSAFTACLVGVGVYLSTSEKEAERWFDGYPFKFVSKLRSGKTAEIDIPDIACIVSVLVPNLSGSHSSYLIPAGTEDVYLLTKPHMGLVETTFSIGPMPEKTI